MIKKYYGTHVVDHTSLVGYPDINDNNSIDWFILSDNKYYTSTDLHGVYIATRIVQDIIELTEASTTDSDPKLGPAEKAIYDSLATAKQKEVFLERQKIYGSVVLCHQQIGRIWAAQLSNMTGTKIEDIPGYMVAQMMASMKLIRASRAYHEDNYIDAVNYSQYAQFMQEHNV